MKKCKKCGMVGCYWRYDKRKRYHCLLMSLNKLNEIQARLKAKDESIHTGTSKV